MDDDFDGPELDGWRVMELMDGFYLVGRVSRHPYLGEGNWIITSPIVDMDAGLRSAKTMNRYYRLLEPWPVQEALPEGAVELMELELLRRMETQPGVDVEVAKMRVRYLAELICCGRGQS